MAISKRFSAIELVNPIDSPISGYGITFGGRIQLRPKDRVLIDNGGSGFRALDIYLSLFSNPVVYSAWDKLVTEITSRDLIVTPASQSVEDLAIAKFIEEAMANLGLEQTGMELPASGGMDTLTRACSASLITGMSPIELVWTRNAAGQRIISYFKQRDPRLFRMEYDDDAHVTRPRLLTVMDTFRGRALPARKFIFCRFWSTPTDDEYGQGIGRQLFYAVEWQKQLLSYWLMLVDKAAIPSTIGSYTAESGANEQLIADFERAVAGFGQDSSIVLPPGFSIDTKSISANSGIVKDLIDRVDTYIATVILGEAIVGAPGGTDQGDSVANSVRVMKAKALSDCIHEILNQTLVRWLVEANYGSKAAVPKIYRNFVEDDTAPPSSLAEVEDISVVIDLLGKLSQQGLNVDPYWIQDKLGVPLKSLQKRPGQPDAANSSATGQSQQSNTTTGSSSKTTASGGGGGQSKTGTALYDNVPSAAELLGL